MGLGALIKTGLHEVPQLMYGSAFMAVWVAGIFYQNHRDEKYSISRKYWKRRYVVVREEDFDPNTQVHNMDRTYPWW